MTSLLFAVTIAVAQANPVLNYVSQDAKTIIRVDLLRLSQKVPWADLSGMFAEGAKKMSPDQLALLKNPAGWGLNLTSGIFLVFKKGEKKSPPVIYGVLTDSAKFGATVRKMHAKDSINKIRGNRLEGSHMILWWNKDVFILMQRPKSAAGATTDAAAQKKQLMESAAGLWKKRSEPFKAEHSQYLFEDHADLLVWSSGNFQPPMQQKGNNSKFLQPLQKSLGRDQGETTAAMNFESGKIALRSSRYFSPTLDSLYRKYPVPSMNPALIERLPAGKAIVVADFAFSPAMMKEIMTKAGAAGSIDSMTKGKITVDDIVASVRGDLVMAVIKLDSVQAGDSVTRGMNGMQILLGGGLKDGKRFAALRDQAMAKVHDTANHKKGMKPLILSNDSLFALSLSGVAAESFLAGNGGSGNTALQQQFAAYKGYSSALVIDLKSIFGFLLQSMSKNKSEEEMKQLSDVLNTFDKIISYSMRGDGGSVTTNLDVTFSDAGENSLKQVLQVVRQVAKIKQNEKKTPKKD
ncbi:MAG TPA: DUF4836 family protein [Chitinophagaceae bacterium]